MCTRPLLAYPSGLTESGATKYRIVPFTKDSYDLFERSGIVEQDFSDRSNLILQIPCGKCQECKLHYAKVWSDRCMLESKYHSSSYFVTLTYDDEHLPYFEKDGLKTPTLVKKHFQDFMKRLRSSIDYKVRFYMCGEYGTHTRRPHYHAIIFGLVLNDLVLYSRTPNGDLLFNSKFLDKLWPFGYVVVGSVTPQSCSYVARYVSKKVGANYDEVYVRTGIQKEYTCMSLKPGIGYQAYSPEIFRKGYECVSTEKGGIKVFPPRYFEKFYQSDCPEEFLEMKSKRIRSMAYKELGTASLCSKDYISYLEGVEDDLTARTRSLHRDL